MRGEQQLVAVLELEFAPLVRRDMTALRADPAAFREDHRRRFLLDHRVQWNVARRRRLGDRRAPRAEQGVEAVHVAQLFQILAQPRLDRKSTRLNSSHYSASRMPSSASN